MATGRRRLRSTAECCCHAARAVAWGPGRSEDTSHLRLGRGVFRPGRVTPGPSPRFCHHGAPSPNLTPQATEAGRRHPPVSTGVPRGPRRWDPPPRRLPGRPWPGPHAGRAAGWASPSPLQAAGGRPLPASVQRLVAVALGGPGSPPAPSRGTAHVVRAVSTCALPVRPPGVWAQATRSRRATTTDAHRPRLQTGSRRVRGTWEFGGAGAGDTMTPRSGSLWPEGPGQLSPAADRGRPTATGTGQGGAAGLPGVRLTVTAASPPSHPRTNEAAPGHPGRARELSASLREGA